MQNAIVRTIIQVLQNYCMLNNYQTQTEVAT